MADDNDHVNRPVLGENSRGDSRDQQRRNDEGPQDEAPRRRRCQLLQKSTPHS